jgi:nitrous oxidase accessory protein NosD
MQRSKASHARAALCEGLLVLVVPTAGLGTTINVPIDSPTIQAAVDLARPGDTILVQPGTYQPVRITGNKAGVTIEAADGAHLPAIQGVRNTSRDGIRVDQQDGITLRNLIIQGAYDGVRLNNATNALLVGLQLENNALGIRVNHGRDNSVIGCTILGVRGDRGVEQGLMVDTSPGAMISGNRIDGAAREGIRVYGSTCVSLDHNDVSSSRGSDGIAVYSSPGASIQACTSRGNYRNGILVSNSSALTLADDACTDNRNFGFLVQQCPPFVVAADVFDRNNTASGNGRDVLVRPGGAPTPTACPGP